MKYSAALNNKTLKMNTGDFLKKLDSNNNGSFSKEELKSGIKESVSVFVKPLITDKVMNSISDMFDKDKNGTITEKEIENFLTKTYNISLNDAKKMNMKDLLDYLQEHEPKEEKK